MNVSRDAITIEGKRVAILATDGYEQSELFEPKRALEGVGAEVSVVAPHAGKIRAWNHHDWGDSMRVDLTLEQADADNFDALVLPGGVMNPDRLRLEPMAVDFVREFVEQGKPIAAICHGPQVLIEVGFLKGRTLTSYPSLRTDLINAGAVWIDQEVVTDKGLVTSRRPDDLPAFNRKMIEEIAEGPHESPTKKAQKRPRSGVRPEASR